ncbi:MAG: MBL fold metallo-hydrolase [Actinomycetota bacterium]|nr:MBL fold metallo-hydrolase [Actinomycetota bacterium]
MVDVVTITTPSLGDRSYLAHDGEVAVVIDPQRDIERFLEAADAAGTRITHVFETHLHNDYVSGGLALAEATGATYVLPAAADVEFPRTPAGDGDRFEAGRLALVALSTPGHTPHHVAYALSEAGRAASAVFTGGSMLFGAVGRTDLVSEAQTDELTRAQYHSVRRLARELPGDAVVLPTHGFGSFCSATPTTGESSTIAEQRTENLALITEDEDEFVERLVAGLGAYPRYYAQMGPANRRGARPPSVEPPRRLDAQALRQRIDAGEWVVDLRRRYAFARHHVAGTISVQLDDSFATLLGWAKRWETPLVLIGDSPQEVADARLELSRIGIDELAGAATGPTDELAAGRISSYPVATFDGLGTVLGRAGVVVLDVRRPDEWHEGHLAGAVHVPFWELEARLDEVPAGEVWVHCAGGYRAAIAASILDRAGRHVVLVDDDWSKAAVLELPMAG